MVRPISALNGSPDRAQGQQGDRREEWSENEGLEEIC